MERWVEDGKNMVSYSSEELQEMVDRGETETNWARHKTDEEMDAAIAADPDATHPTDEELAQFKTTWGEVRPGPGRPKGSIKTDTKVPVSVRLSPHIATWLKEQRHQGVIIEEALKQAHNLQ